MRNIRNLKDFDAIRIYLASDEQKLDWSYGKVVKPETINYRTYKAERDGLFDERIFGPTKNYECYCGKYKGIRYKGVICDKCGVEVTHSRVRRERMGHIELASPVAHVWFFKGIPSKMAILLNMSPRNVESIIYFASFIVTEIDKGKKAEAISRINEDFEKVKTYLEKELEEKIKDLNKEIKNIQKSGDELKASESELKIKQKIQQLRSLYDKKIEEQEKTYKLIEKKISSVELYSVISENEYITLEKYLDPFCKLEIGAEALQGILKSMDLNKEAEQTRLDMEETNSKQKTQKLAKRLRVIEQFRRSEINPERMIFNILPVIPPKLRPMVQLEGGRFAASDLNDLYRRVINRNNRLQKLLDIGAPEIIIQNEKRMLQESVDALIDASKKRKKSYSRRREPRSLTDMIKGKQGVFRLNLLGKRVDYSGRAVIINGPNLKLDECGLPKEMALELFKPMVLREIIGRGYAPNIRSAKFYLENRSSEVWDILEEVVEGHPVLLNRAPTLWRLGIQAFYPKLIEGNSIRLHLCVCTGYNADFDGDQMAVHVPLSKEAISEAENVMLSVHNLMKPSDGSPISIPEKIMLFGIYYVTSIDEKLPLYEKPFSTKSELLYAVDVNEEVSLRQRILYLIEGKLIETTPGRVIFNEILPENFEFINYDVGKSQIKALLNRAFDNEENEVVVNLIDDIKSFGFKYGTLSGHSISLGDVDIPKEREPLINEGKKKVAEIENNYSRGLITRSEAADLKAQVWERITADIDESVWTNLSEDNAVKLLVKSGSTRASREQVKQIAGIRGSVADPMGKIVEVPILGNYKIGLSAMEYFVGSRGARKGLVDKGLKTADAGYLTRRLVDVTQDVIIREEDCGTETGREMIVGEGTLLQSFAGRVRGRYLAQDVKDGRKIVAKAGVLIDEDLAKEIEDRGIKKIFIRSSMYCETRRGICSKCYGTDLMTGKPVKVGMAVGVAAAQSIGEPGTQLTMKTFHTGGIAKKDITSGLPRVEELVEARTPKNQATMSEISGTARIEKSGDDRKVVVIPDEAGEEVVEYKLDPVAEIAIKDGQKVEKGSRITEGDLDLSELFSNVGIAATKKYIIDEIQKVYASQGVVLNDKHVEIVVKKMFNHVEIEDAGDTEFMPGELITQATFEEENEEVIASGGEPATGTLMLLGITKASLNTDSFLAAASFIHTSSVLTDAASSGKVDYLLGLKENVIIGRLIPTGERAEME